MRVRERSADDELLAVLLDELVERGQRNAPAAHGIEIHLVAVDVVPGLVLEVQRTIGFRERLFFRQGDGGTGFPVALLILAATSGNVKDSSARSISWP